jgi:prepilin-type N-terminal cleavage/methylation domain-containing protein
MPSSRRRTSGRRGFTLIELMVTVFLLGVGLAGLVATSGAVSRMMGGSSREATAATVAASRFEKLRGAACASISPELRRRAESVNRGASRRSIRAPST